MPKLEPKVIQRELEQGVLWPVYWIHGPEKMKSRELLGRIRQAVGGQGMGEQILDGDEVDAETVMDAARSPALWGGVKLVIVRDAHLIKNADCFAELCRSRAAPGTKEELSSVCVFLAKDLDGRKKLSKILVEKAAVVPCEEIPEAQREAWIQYLAKRRGLTLAPGLAARLCAQEPWGLELIDRELEKYALALESGETAESAAEVLLGAGPGSAGADEFLEAFFSRNLKGALSGLDGFADQPDEALPLLGLLAWNARHLALIVHRSGIKLNPYAAEKMARWSRHWNKSDAVELQARLAEVDFGIKQTQLLSLGLWGELVQRFCR